MNETINKIEIPGWFDWQVWAQETICNLFDGAVYIEIGCFLGKSTVAIAQIIQKSRKKIQFHAIDTFVLDPATAEPALLQHVVAGSAAGQTNPVNFRKRFEANLCVTGTRPYVRIVQKTSVAAAAEYQDAFADVIFIDADHSYEAVKADIGAWWRVLKPGGVMAGHDINTYQSVRKAVHDAFAEMSIIPQVVNEQNIWTVRKS